MYAMVFVLVTYVTHDLVARDVAMTARELCLRLSGAFAAAYSYTIKSGPSSIHSYT